MRRLAQITITLLVSLITTACHISGTITDVEKASLKESQKRKSPDTIIGETVKTTKGTANYQIKASFGEISEVKNTTSNYRIEGVFYE